MGILILDTDLIYDCFRCYITERFITITGPSLRDLFTKENDVEFKQELVGENYEESLTEQQICQIMGSIQLGIKHEFKFITSIPKFNSFPGDFKDISTIMFRNWHDTNNNIPFPDFSFSTYAPLTFHYFRGLFGIEAKDYLTSFCSSPLHELSNPGASKSKFYLTPDDKFIMKTVQETEDECLLKLLSSYSTCFSGNLKSLLPKFSGFYGFKSKSIDIKLVSMNNLLPSNIKMHQQFDLKGSTLGREASDREKNKTSPTFKDLDFICELHPKGIFLKPEIRLALLETIKRDCKTLKYFKIMDYSLLMGVHNIDHPLKTDDDTSPNTYASMLAAKAWWESLMDDSVEEKSIQADTETFSDENYASLKHCIPAKSVNIIDILQTYGRTKSLERSFKSLILKLTPSATENAYSISVQPPEFYSSRFLQSMTDSVFKPMLSPQELDELSKQPIDILLLSKRGCTKIAAEKCSILI
ncbi:unnamed protein product [Macrosiphum euphorbiae]|uniref:PIPK domain-containing protein n=1 Tax=Macrosiphum euphorbiae TaxID=13131 RepID=A0AAV0YB64_9HEMI|nr:unnamed protein product [Macrosiphum euphorbiae]